MRSISILGFSTGAWILAATQCLGQSPALTIVNLAPPTYPPIAEAARQSGEVKLSITLSSEGKATGIQVISGPPMLRDAALNSAKGSLFQVSLQQASAPYELIYKFELDALDCGQHPDPTYPKVAHSANTITVNGTFVPFCDPAADIRVRSVKCLYLWRCSRKTP